MAKKKSGSKFEAVLRELGEEVTKHAVQALSDGADLVVSDAQRRCPVREGALKASIHKIAEKSGRRVKIVADAVNKKGFSYAPIVEYRPKRRHPFLHPALDAQRDKVREMIADAVRKAVKASAKF